MEQNVNYYYYVNYWKSTNKTNATIKVEILSDETEILKTPAVGKTKQNKITLIFASHVIKLKLVVR